eukprot:6205605-Pleurochrysis_carterae.AAC.1
MRLFPTHYASTASRTIGTARIGAAALLLARVHMCTKGRSNKGENWGAEASVVAAEMKEFEAATCDAVVDSSKIGVLRLDGCCFHTFSVGFRKPFDARISDSMVATAANLMQRLQASAAYTESDEISLFFPQLRELPYNGRVQKLASVAAGYASARFNKHMRAQSFDEARPRCDAMLSSGDTRQSDAAGQRQKLESQRRASMEMSAFSVCVCNATARRFC